MNGPGFSPGRLGTGAPLLTARLAVIAMLIVLWQGMSGRIVDPVFISDPVRVIERLALWSSNGHLWFHLQTTLQEAFLGFVLGTAGGMSAGVALGLSPFVRKLLDPIVMAVASLPEIALAPLFVLWFGVGLEMKVILAASVVFFYVFWSTLAGVRDVDPRFVNVLRVMAATRAQLLTKVIVPSALTWLYVGLKVSVPHALLGAVVGELLVGDRGIGYLLLWSAQNYDTPGLMAGIVVLMALSAGFNELVVRSEGRVLRWKHES